MINHSAFFSVPLIIQLHAIAAVMALLFGVALLLGKKGTMGHRAVGKLWVALMAFVAGSSFWISGHRAVFWELSPIHALSALALMTMVSGVLAARRGQVERHKKTMRMLFFFALIGAGLFTFVPGRLMHTVFIS